VWLDFEDIILEKSKTVSLVSYEEITKIAEQAGIFEKDEIEHSIRFLSDLGTLQYFEKNGLNNTVVINPQWIVDVMSCVVTVKESCIQDGKLYHKDLNKIWQAYDPSLHEWMLNLTEVFDLTFRIPNKEMNLVPCLLPDREPVYYWPNINENKTIKLKEFKVVYSFSYLPAGLFNRLQVRLFQYSDISIIWKNGSFLNKNNHIALISQNKKSLISIKVQGIKPENIIFIIHEVLEALINESFHGIQYDYEFPCPDCVDSQITEPCLFSSSLLKRANDLKAPFLQCHKFFHVISIPEMLSIMPVEGLKNFDFNLDSSLRDIKQMKNNLKYDIFFWYCIEDTKQSSCSPLKVIDLIKKENYKIWHLKLDNNDEKIDKLTYKMKESKLAILCISDNFAKDEKCLQIFELVKNIIKKNYILIEFGEKGKNEWLKNATFASVSTDSRVIMQDPKRFNSKVTELFELLDRQLSFKNKSINNEQQLDVFISYRWSNSHDAIRKGTQPTKTSLGWLDPRSLIDFFKKNNINAWLDIEEASQEPQGLFGQITKGLNEASVMVACISDEYCVSENCLLEFRFAHSSLRKPIVKAIVGTGNEWKKHEISFLSGSYTEINFQYENLNAYDQLLEWVKNEIGKLNEKNKLKKTAETNETRLRLAEYNNASIQELYELTQRKFLKQLIQISDKMITIKAYPRLIFIDLIENDLVESIQRKTIYNTLNDSNNDRLLIPCLRLMCENEEGWHPVSTFFGHTNTNLLTGSSSFNSYLLRIMNILKYGNLTNELTIFLSKQGTQIINEIENKPCEYDLIESYGLLRKILINDFETGNIWSMNNLELNNNNQDVYDRIGLERCELKNGKILWLCKNHVSKTQANVLSNNYADTSGIIESNQNRMLNHLKDNNNLNIFE
jgi:hypothetical protein